MEELISYMQVYVHTVMTMTAFYRKSYEFVIDHKFNAFLEMGDNAFQFMDRMEKMLKDVFLMPSTIIVFMEADGTEIYSPEFDDYVPDKEKLRYMLAVKDNPYPFDTTEEEWDRFKEGKERMPLTTYMRSILAQ
jgi:hypothetical protein